MLRLALAVLLSVLLAGCILETERPLFKEEDGALALGRKASAYGAWNKVNGTWQEAKTEAGHLILNPEGRHYRIEIVDAASKDTTQEQMRVLFVPLAQKKFVLQAEADGENPVYAIGELVGRDLLISALFCTDLKKTDAASKEIIFEGLNCRASKVKNPREFLARIASSLPPPELKLAPTR